MAVYACLNSLFICLPFFSKTTTPNGKIPCIRDNVNYDGQTFFIKFWRCLRYSVWDLFGICRGYQPQPSASADNPYLDLDYSYPIIVYNNNNNNNNNNNKLKGDYLGYKAHMGDSLSYLDNLLEILINKSGLWQRKEFFSSYFRRQSHCIQSDRSNGNQERWSALDSCQRCLHRQNTCHCWNRGEWNTDLSSPVLLNTI